MYMFNMNRRYNQLIVVPIVVPIVVSSVSYQWEIYRKHDQHVINFLVGMGLYSTNQFLTHS